MEAVPLQSDKQALEVDVCLTAASVATREKVHEALQREFGEHTSVWEVGGVEVGKLRSAFLRDNVADIVISTPDEHVPSGALLFWQVEPRFNIFQLSEELSTEDDEGEDGVPTYRDWLLPCSEFHGLWDALCYDANVKGRLLAYAQSALAFSQLGVDSQMINWNRYSMALLVEVSAHSLFSKWFSESGKLVSKLFSKITEMVEDPDTLVFVLIDEVESLTAARQAAVSGSEPSDAIRAVNALLTQLDALKSRPNVMVLCTSNLCAAIDAAFIDRADIKVFIGPPPLPSRYQILRSCVLELRRVGFLHGTEEEFPRAWSPSLANAGSGSEADGRTSMEDGEGMAGEGRGTLGLLAVAEASAGFSGRALRKLPFQAHARRGFGLSSPCADFLDALRWTVEAERADQEALSVT